MKLEIVELELVILRLHYVKLHEGYWRWAPRNSEPWSSQEDDIRVGTNPLLFPHYTNGSTFEPQQIRRASTLLTRILNSTTLKLMTRVHDLDH
ncbi:hypothetical protein TNCV_4630741 [Trichonephila clavipes]|nr:hypothetical protein TNCV_4630741 [Trichonephila clavipes]